MRFEAARERLADAVPDVSNDPNLKLHMQILSMNATSGNLVSRRVSVGELRTSPRMPMKFNAQFIFRYRRRWKFIRLTRRRCGTLLEWVHPSYAVEHTSGSIIMVFYRHAYRQEPTRPRNIGRRTVMAVLLALGCVRILSRTSLCYQAPHPLVRRRYPASTRCAKATGLSAP